MANVKKFGEAVVITSGAKLEDIRKIAKYRPEKLVLMGGEDGKEPIFAVGLSGNRSGSINKYSIDFGGCDENGLAQVTVAYTGPAEGVKEALADSIGPQVMMLTKLEDSFRGVLDEINADVNRIMESITIG